MMVARCAECGAELELQRIGTRAGHPGIAVGYCFTCNAVTDLPEPEYAEGYEPRRRRDLD